MAKNTTQPPSAPPLITSFACSKLLILSTFHMFAATRNGSRKTMSWTFLPASLAMTISSRSAKLSLPSITTPFCLSFSSKRNLATATELFPSLSSWMFRLRLPAQFANAPPTTVLRVAFPIMPNAFQFILFTASYNPHGQMLLLINSQILP